MSFFGKPSGVLFDEFDGKKKLSDDPDIAGDVKYHMGYSSDVRTPGGPVHMALAFNPSHLEIVSPVVHGSVRARQDRRGDTERKQVLPITVHGDAAVSGQGVVMETLNFSRLRGFTTGGAIRIVINAFGPSGCASIALKRWGIPSRAKRRGSPSLTPSRRRKMFVSSRTAKGEVPAVSRTTRAIPREYTSAA